MEEEVELSRFQIQVARIFFRLKASEGYVVAAAPDCLRASSSTDPPRIWTSSLTRRATPSPPRGARSSRLSSAADGLSPSS